MEVVKPVLADSGFTPVVEVHDAVGEAVFAHELELPPEPRRKPARPTSDDDGRDKQVVFVDQPRGNRLRSEIRTTDTEIVGR